MRIIVFLVLVFTLVQGCATAEEKFEPKEGCYLGIALDWADIATEENGRTTTDKFTEAIVDFNRLTGKRHGLIKQFIYFPHGAAWEKDPVYAKFPSWDSDPAGWATAKEFCEAVDRNGGTPVITLEPHARFEDFYTKWEKLNPAYEATVDFAKGCSNFKKPMFIVFAHEMNGSWYPWSVWIDKNKNLKRDAGEETGHTTQDYQQAFRNVSNVFHELAPNVAVVWCPNQGWLGEERLDLYTPFYPGDEYVDWVGLDFYERGWNMPDIDAKLWGGMFIHGLTHDSLDDAETDENESVNFYKTFCEKKGKPLMIGETAATFTYRTDISEKERREMSHGWKAGWWSPKEYGWLFGVYGTSYFRDSELSYKIDKLVPKLKAIIWFNQAKIEDMPVEKSRGNKGEPEIIWFNNGWLDYRIGWNTVSMAEKYSTSGKYEDEISLYRALIDNSHFLSREVKNSGNK